MMIIIGTLFTLSGFGLMLLGVYLISKAHYYTYIQEFIGFVLAVAGIVPFAFGLLFLFLPLIEIALTS